MNKKIDFFNKNIMNDINNNKMPINKNKYNSKTSKLNKTKISAVKKRGRRIQKILNNTDEIVTKTNESENNNKDDSAVILRLNIDPSKICKLTNNDNLKKNIETSDSSEGMFNNDIPNDSICHKCCKNEKIIALLKSKLEKFEKKKKIDKTNKIYVNNISFISYTTDKKISIKKTDKKCWWDSYSFNNLPCFLPELYHNNIYYVRGCFCSFNCALAYNLYYIKDSKTNRRTTLIYKLYRELYGLNVDDPLDIKEAPPKEIIGDYGGDPKITIDVYRKTFNVLNKNYIIFVPPIKPINIIVEEHNTDSANINSDDSDKYTLKRSKPLNNKYSVLSSMKVNIDNNE